MITKRTLIRKENTMTVSVCPEMQGSCVQGFTTEVGIYKRKILRKKRKHDLDKEKRKKTRP